MTRLSAGDRLRRLLAIIPWLAERGGASFDEIAERFGMSEAETVRELELAACCGLPPYTPDRLIELVLDDTGVSARVPDYFRRPMHLTPAEGFAVLAAGRALLAVAGGGDDGEGDGGGALARALATLEAALGDRGAVTVELDAPEHLRAVREATANRERLSIDYYSASRDEMTTREIDPHTVVSVEGHWYADAYCHAVDGERRFRIDRIRALRTTGEHFEPPAPSGAPTTAFRPTPDTPTVVLDLPPEAGWVLESFPSEVVRERADGRRQVRVAVGGTAWLERVLLQLGPDARVVEPDELAGVGAQAAARVLRRYRPRRRRARSGAR